MENSVRLHSVDPQYAIPGGEISIACEGFRYDPALADGVYVDGVPCRIVGASTRRILAIVPDDVWGAGSSKGKNQIYLQSLGNVSNTAEITAGRKLADGMHIVANPAVDPSDDAIILTRSGSRGQHLPATLFRLDPAGNIDEFPHSVLNPTGIAFDADGDMFVSNRAEGDVYSIDRSGSTSVFASGLGIVTGLAFDRHGWLYAGDRAGTIYRITPSGETETFTVMEASVAAYHLAFGPDGRLYMTAPGLASHDSVHVIDHEGFDEKYFRGLGRPQGLAFDKAGNLYVAACFKGRHGIVKIGQGGASCEHIVAGNGIVGLCFTRTGDMIVATGDCVYSLPCGIEGTLL